MWQAPWHMDFSYAGNIIPVIAYRGSGTKLYDWKWFHMKEAEQQDLLKWSSNPGELKSPSNTFPSQKQLHKISPSKISEDPIKRHSLKSCCSLQLIKHFQIHSSFDPPEDGLCRGNLTSLHVGKSCVSGSWSGFLEFHIFFGQMFIECLPKGQALCPSGTEPCLPILSVVFLPLPPLSWIYCVVHPWTLGRIQSDFSWSECCFYSLFSFASPSPNR